MTFISVSQFSQVVAQGFAINSTLMTAIKMVTSLVNSVR